MTGGEKYVEAGSNVTVQNQGTIALEHYRFAGMVTEVPGGCSVSAGRKKILRNEGYRKDGNEKNEAVMVEEGLYFYSRWIPLYQVVYHARRSGRRTSEG